LDARPTEVFLKLSLSHEHAAPLLAAARDKERSLRAAVLERARQCPQGTLCAEAAGLVLKLEDQLERAKTSLAALQEKLSAAVHKGGDTLSTLAWQDQSQRAALEVVERALTAARENHRQAAANLSRAVEAIAEEVRQDALQTLSFLEHQGPMGLLPTIAPYLNALVSGCAIGEIKGWNWAPQAASQALADMLPPSSVPVPSVPVPSPPFWIKPPEADTGNVFERRTPAAPSFTRPEGPVLVERKS
jgi:hypothetical protein